MLALSAASAAGAWLALGCNEDDVEQAPAPQESAPNAAIVTPAPLASGGALVNKTNKSAIKPSSKRAATAEPPEPPTPLSVQQAPTADVTTPKQQAQLTLAGRLVWPAFPQVLRPNVAPGKAPEDAPRHWRSFSVNARSAGRLNIRFTGASFTFDDGTQFAARIENYGHFLVWPGERHYRVLPPGSVRTLLTEGRPDVTPMVPMDPEARPNSETFGHPSQVWLFETSRGKLHLQQAEIPEAELAGPLLCRFLLEWISVAPSSSACDSGLVPVRAEFDVGRGKLIWETTELDLRAEPQATLNVPPRESQFREFGLPTPGEVMAANERGALRRTGRTGRLTAYNPAPVTTWLLLDGVAVARLQPAASSVVEGLSFGTYQARLIDFFGEEVQAQPNLTLNEMAAFGAPKPPVESNDEQ